MMNNKCTGSWHCCMVGQHLSSMHCLIIIIIINDNL